MNITELDEWQGLTAELVAKWLVVNGWQQTKPNWWDKGEDGFLFDSHVFDQQMFWLYALAAACGHNTPQDLLREINPRLRKGMPSEAAQKARAYWLVRDIETGEVELHRTEGAALYSASDYKSGALKTEAVALRDFGDWMEFWPCDANGNKVQWPTDAEGNML